MMNKMQQTAARAQGSASPAGQAFQSSKTITARNAFGVPVMSPRVSLLARSAGHAYARAAGDALGDASQAITDWQAAHPGDEVPDSLYAALDSAIDVPVPDTSSGTAATATTQEDRDNIARQNQQLIGLASGVIASTGAAITAAITSGSAERIAAINAEARTAAAMYQSQAQQAIIAARSGSPTAAADLATATRNAQISQQLAALTAAQGGSKTTTYLMIGAGVLAVGAIAYFTMGKGSKTRRNPSEPLMANPVMIKRGKGKRGKSGKRGKPRTARKFVRADKVSSYRARGWSRAR